MQEREFGIDPISNLVVGLTFFQLWYRSIPEELQLRNVDESYVSMESEMLKTEVDMSLDNPDGHDTAEVKEAKFSVEYGSNTSIRIDKKNCLEPDADQQKEVFVEVDNNLYGESMYKHFQMQEISVTAERSGHEESSFSVHSGDIPNTSIFYAHGLQPWLFPIRWHNSNKNMEYLIYMHRTLRNDYYKNAIKYLRLALYSTPPAFEALLPLVQILLVGDQAEKALAELEKFGRSSSTTLTSKLKAHLLEHLDGNNYVKLSACFEDILMKDPACIYSLERLISMHQSGDYSTEKLVEMVALHLDASYAESKIWKVFSSCFLNLSLCEEDRISTCLDSSKEVPHKQNYSRRLNRLPGTFTDGVFRKEWRFRCRWWLTRHFSQSILASDVDSGDPWMLAYKAACACHLYGQELEYVVKASASLKQEKYTDMLAFLQMHKQNSVGFYLNFERKTKL